MKATNQNEVLMQKDINLLITVNRYQNAISRWMDTGCSYSDARRNARCLSKKVELTEKDVARIKPLFVTCCHKDAEIYKTDKEISIIYPRYFGMHYLGLLEFTEEEKNQLFDEVVTQVVRKASQNGFAISKQAIRHNLEAWEDGYKSSYRDEANKACVYSANGLNRLKFVITELADNDQTYIA